MILAGTYSKRSLLSQPISHLGLPQWGQIFSAGSIRSVRLKRQLNRLRHQQRRAPVTRPRDGG